jgi:Zn-dependent protease with chaperone function
VSLVVSAALLAAGAVVLLGPFSSWLARSAWVSRAPRAAVVLWQSIGVSAGVAGMGAGLCVAVERFHADFLSGLGDLGAGLVDGHPLRGLGLPDALGLTLAADLGVVLLCLAATAMVRTISTRARHRTLLNLLAAETSHQGTVMLDHPDAVAYCLPGLRPRIVISTGTMERLTHAELAAVIEHERGHAEEHHGLIMLPMAALSDLFRWIPYARLAPSSVGALLEMAADDHAARRRDPASLASALVQMATAHAPPRCTFAAAAAGVPARVARLMDPQRSSRRTALVAGTAAAMLLAIPVASLLLS